MTAFFFNLQHIVSHLLLYIEKLWPVLQTTNNGKQEPITKKRNVYEGPIWVQTASEPDIWCVSLLFKAEMKINYALAQFVLLYVINKTPTKGLKSLVSQNYQQDKIAVYRYQRRLT